QIETYIQQEQRAQDLPERLEPTVERERVRIEQLYRHIAVDQQQDAHRRRTLNEMVDALLEIDPLQHQAEQRQQDQRIAEYPHLYGIMKEQPVEITYEERKAHVDIEPRLRAQHTD